MRKSEEPNYTVTPHGFNAPAPRPIVVAPVVSSIRDAGALPHCASSAYQPPGAHGLLRAPIISSSSVHTPSLPTSFPAGGSNPAARHTNITNDAVAPFADVGGTKKLSSPRRAIGYSSIAHYSEDGTKLHARDLNQQVNLSLLNCRWASSSGTGQSAISTLIGVTMYNESPSDVENTLAGIVDNMSHRPDSVNAANTVVVLVADGIDRLPDETKQYLERVGILDRAVPEFKHTGDLAQVHIFSSTVAITSAASGAQIDMNVVFALKTRNAGKLDSHAWVIEGFVPCLRPEFLVFLDVGTRPRKSAIAMLVDEMRGDSTVAGCCGEISVESPWARACCGGSPFVIAAQHFEYTMANALDKSYESMSGCISVLPGAFSAFRVGPWSRDPETLEFSPHGPLQGHAVNEYLRPLSRRTLVGFDDLSPFKKNMYLAEDRILCWLLLSSGRGPWFLRYVAGAIADTDPMSSLDGLVAQRRRWLNGSFFAKLYALGDLGRYFRLSEHSAASKCLVAGQFLLGTLQMTFDWLAPALLFVMFRSSTDLCFGVGSPGLAMTETDLSWVSGALQASYGATVLLVLLANLTGAKARDLAWTHGAASCIFGVFALATLATMVFAAFATESVLLQMFLAVSFGIYVIVGALHGHCLRVCVFMMPYLCMLPSYINIFTIHSMCNLNDVSWGTRPQTASASSPLLDRKADGPRAAKVADLAQQQRSSGARCFMLTLLTLFLVSNIFVVVATTDIGEFQLLSASSFLAVVCGLQFASLLIRFAGSASYVARRRCRRW